MADQNYRLGTECNSGTRDVPSDVTLRVDGRELELVPFVQNLIRNTTLAVVSELEGYSEGAKIEITIGQ
jgi:molybdopterin-guanine dinucleotide biosynthesis protein B